MPLPIISLQLSQQQQAFILQQLALLVSAGHSLHDATLKLKKKAPYGMRKSLADLRESLDKPKVKQNKKKEILGDYLRNYLTSKPSQEGLSKALRAVALFKQKVGEESKNIRRLLRGMSGTLWLFLGGSLLISKLIILHESQFSDLTFAYYIPVQVSILISELYEDYPFLLLILIFLIRSILRWLRLRGWLPFTRGQIKRTKNILIAEAVITICRSEGEKAITMDKVAKLLPLWQELKSLRTSLRKVPKNLPLQKALESIRGVPSELTASIQNGIEGGDLILSLESFLTLQRDRQTQVTTYFKRAELLALIISISLLLIFYFVGIDFLINCVLTKQ